MSAETRLYALDTASDIWRRAASSVKSGVQWLGGALAGEFNTQASVGQILFDAVISMFPIVGEATAGRDVIAITLRMSDSDAEAENVWNWVSLVLCLLAVVPVIGGLLKGVGRLLVPLVSDASKLVEVARDIMAFLRKRGYGNAFHWLKKLDFSTYQSDVLRAMRMEFSRLRHATNFILRNFDVLLPASVKIYLKALPPKLERLEQLGERMVPKAIKELNALLNKVREQLVEGTYIPITVGAQKEVRVHVVEARIAEKSPITIASKGHTAATVKEYQHKEGWPDLRSDGKRIKLPDGKWTTEYKAIPSFSRKAPIEPVLLRAGDRCSLVRVIDTGNPRKAGDYWAEALPENGKAWRLNCAVKQGWSNNGAYVRLGRIPTGAELRHLGISVPHDWDGVRAWRGKIAEQIDDEANVYIGTKPTGILLPGGDTQLFIDFKDPHNKPIAEFIEKHIPTNPTNWSDTLLPQHVEAVGEYLHAQEYAAKVASDGYARRGAATAGKQTNNE